MADTKENNIWARLQSQQQHDQTGGSKARVRLLLDEIALLQARFENKETGPFARPNKHGRAEAKLNSSSAGREELPVLRQQQHLAAGNSAFPSNEELVSSSTGPDCSPSDELVQAVDLEVSVVLSERFQFYEAADNELRVGKIDRQELVKVLEIDKRKLQKHRKDVSELHERLQELFSGQLQVHLQAIVRRLEELLTERENFHVKFEVQVELGHFYRLLKLLDLQKTKHITAKRELEQLVKALKTVEQEDESGASGSAQQAADDEHSQLHEDTPIPGLSSLQRGEAKKDLLKLVSDQEKKWITRQQLVEELERRMRLCEMENQRLTDIIKESQDRERKNTCWTKNLPEGYSSVYFSPIFQERKSEARSLKLQQIEQRGTLPSERLEVPAQEKTIRVDASSMVGSLSSCLLNEEKVLKKMIQSAVELLKQRRGSTEVEVIEQLYSEIRSQLHASKKDKTKEERDITLQADAQTLEANHALKDMEDQVEVLKRDLARAAEEHARELDTKKKALVYAQDLNMRMAKDMSVTKNALLELRAEYKGMKTLFESKLRDARLEAELLVQGLRSELEILGSSMANKEEEARLRDEKGSEENNKQLENARKLTDECAALQREVEMAKSAAAAKEAELIALAGKNSECERRNSQLAEEISSANKELTDAKLEVQRLEERCAEMQSRAEEMEYELEQREEALERLTLHLASVVESQSMSQEWSAESLRSKHFKRQMARKSIEEAEQKMASMATEMSQAKLQLEELRSLSRSLSISRS